MARTRMQCRARVASAFLCAIVAISIFTEGAAAQTSTLTTRMTPGATVGEKVPAMVTYLRNGEVVFQNEVLLEKGVGVTWNKELTAGVYDVRVEAEGLVTEAKRGVRVLAGQSHDLMFVVRPGKGMHVVEYATGGVAREEVAARLGALEAAVTKLQPPGRP